MTDKSEKTEYTALCGNCKSPVKDGEDRYCSRCGKKLRAFWLYYIGPDGIRIELPCSNRDCKTGCRRVRDEKCAFKTTEFEMLPVAGGKEEFSCEIICKNTGDTRIKEVKVCDGAGNEVKSEGEIKEFLWRRKFSLRRGVVEEYRIFDGEFEEDFHVLKIGLRKKSELSVETVSELNVFGSGPLLIAMKNTGGECMQLKFKKAGENATYFMILPELKKFDKSAVSSISNISDRLNFEKSIVNVSPDSSWELKAQVSNKDLFFYKIFKVFSRMSSSRAGGDGSSDRSVVKTKAKFGFLFDGQIKNDTIYFDIDLIMVSPAYLMFKKTSADEAVELTEVRNSKTLHFNIYNLGFKELNIYSWKLDFERRKRSYDCEDCEKMRSAEDEGGGAKDAKNYSGQLNFKIFEKTESGRRELTVIEEGMPAKIKAFPADRPKPEFREYELDFILPKFIEHEHLTAYIDIETNSGESDLNGRNRRKIKLAEITVREAKVLSGYASIDLGASFTCMAYSDEKYNLPFSYRLDIPEAGGGAMIETAVSRPDLFKSMNTFLYGKYNAGLLSKNLENIKEFVKKLRGAAEKENGFRIEKLVVAMPAGFLPERKNELKNILSDSGFEKKNIRMVSRSVASVLWHTSRAGRLSKTDGQKSSGPLRQPAQIQNFLNIDFGGGNTELALVMKSSKDNGLVFYEISSFCGIEGFGGGRIDRLIRREFISKIKKENPGADILVSEKILDMDEEKFRGDKAHKIIENLRVLLEAACECKKYFDDAVNILADKDKDKDKVPEKKAEPVGETKIKIPYADQMSKEKEPTFEIDKKDSYNKTISLFVNDGDIEKADFKVSLNSSEFNKIMDYITGMFKKMIDFISAPNENMTNIICLCLLNGQPFKSSLLMDKMKKICGGGRVLFDPEYCKTGVSLGAISCVSKMNVKTVSDDNLSRYDYVCKITKEEGDSFETILKKNKPIVDEKKIDKNGRPELVRHPFNFSFVQKNEETGKYRIDNLYIYANYGNEKTPPADVFNVNENENFAGRRIGRIDQDDIDEKKYIKKSDKGDYITIYFEVDENENFKFYIGENLNAIPLNFIYEKPKSLKVDDIY